jgi:hypothetical protein
VSDDQDTPARDPSDAEGQDQNFLAIPEDIVPRTASAFTLLAAYGLGAADVGLPGVGTAAGAMLAFFRRNQNDALAATEAALEGHSQSLESLTERVERAEIDRDQIHRRLTLAIRCLNEAGRHPHKELRQALGTFTGRVLVTDMDGITALQLADCLARLTSLEYACLEVLWSLRERTCLAQMVWVEDPTRGHRAAPTYQRTAPEHCTAHAEFLVLALQNLDYAADAAVIEIAQQRLLGLGLICEVPPDGPIMPAPHGEGALERMLEEQSKPRRLGLTSLGLALIDASSAPGSPVDLPAPVDARDGPEPA